jgi:hypothetical protein
MDYESEEFVIFPQPLKISLTKHILCGCLMSGAFALYTGGRLLLLL